MSDQVKPSFFQELWNRRFFQFLATYIAVCWGIVQFLLFAVERYQWDNSVIEKFLLFAIIMLPAVLVFIYNHGRAGDDEWKPYEKILVPGNLLVAIGAAMFVNVGTSEAKSERISLVTDEGETIIREVPNVQFTNRIALFPLENKTGDESLDWLSHGFPILADADMEQDMRVISVESDNLSQSYASYNQDRNEEISLGTKLSITRDRYADHFVTGSFTKEGDGIRWNIELRRTKDSKVVLEKEYIGNDMYQLVDQYSSDIHNYLYSAEVFGEEDLIDLPVESLISDNIEAYEYFVKAKLALRENKIDEAKELMDKAISLDPNCAECYTYKGLLHNVTQDIEATQKAIKKAGELSSKLPERQQLFLKSLQYQVNFQADKSKRLLTRWMKLYPHDSKPYFDLMAMNKVARNYDKAKEIGELAIKNGHEGRFFTEMTQLCMSTKDFEKAEYYLKEFSERYPEKGKESSLLGDILSKQGKLKEAESFYEEVSIFNPDDHSIFLKIADLANKQGNFEKAKVNYNEALKVANTARDTVGVLFNKLGHYERQGKIDSVFVTMTEHEKMSLKYTQPFIYNATTLMQFMPYYIYAGKEAEFEKELTEKFPLDKNVMQNGIFHNIAKHLKSTFTKDKENYWDNYLKAKPILIQSIGPDYELVAQGMKHQFEGEYEMSNENLKKYVDSTDTPLEDMAELIAENYIELKQFDECLEICNEVLKTDPKNHKILYFVALTHHRNNDSAKAKKAMNELMSLYKDADENYTLYQRAKELNDLIQSDG